MSKGFELYDHNKKSYNKIKKFFANNEHIACIVHATGTGKSYNGLQFAYDNKDKKIMYITPTNAIIEHLYDLIKKADLNLEKDFNHVKFATYSSLVNLSKEDINKMAIDALIVDEFHHIGAPIWGKRINEIIKTHPNIDILGLTAYTVRDRGSQYERDLTNSLNDELFADKVVSRYDLCDAMIDGVLPKPIYKSIYIGFGGVEKELEDKIYNGHYSHSDLVKYEKILHDCKSRITDAKGVKDLIIDNIKKDGKYIYFCPPYRVEGINDVESIMKEAKNWFKGYLDDEDIQFYVTTSADDKNGKINRQAFYNDVDLNGNSTKNKLRIMFAINQYNEGVHAPGLDGVILGRNTSSDIVFFEQIGRALSVVDNQEDVINKYSSFSREELIELAKKRGCKKLDNMSHDELIGCVTAPVIIDLTNNYEYIKELQDNLQDRLKEAKKSQKNGSRNIKLTDASFDIDILNFDLFQMLEYLKTRTKSPEWEEMYDLASKFHQSFGHINIPARFRTNDGINYDAYGKQLGKWLHTQKATYCEGKLLLSRKASLDKLGMVWDKYNDIEWMENLELCKNYYQYHHDLYIPDGYKTINGYEYDESGVKLGVWLNNQRANYKNGKLSTERIDYLNNIGMVFTNVFDIKWQSKYDIAKKYYEEHGNLDVKVGYKVDKFDLGKWVQRQRQLNDKGQLKEERKQLLEQIGMSWQDAYDLEWLDNYQLVSSYFEKHHHLNIPKSFKTINGYEYNDQGKDIGRWLINQKALYNNGTLREDRQKLLSKVGMDWEKVFEKEWHKNYEEAKNYYKEHHNLDIPPASKLKIDGSNKNLEKLGSWLYNQKYEYSKGTLSNERKQLLENVGINWNSFYDIEWEKKYNILKKYYEEHGNLDILSSLEDSNVKDLLSWINTQKSSYVKGTLLPTKAIKLSSLGIVFETRKNKEAKEEFCLTHNIPISNNQEIIEHIPYKLLESKTNYLNDKNIPLVVNNKMHEIYTMSNKDMNKKYNISLQELLKKYSKTYIKKGS